MRIEFDKHKSDKNVENRNLSFDEACNFDWEEALFSEDDRNQYPERRFVGIGYLEHRLHVICFTPIEAGVRIISFRKANKREVNRYEKTIKQ